MIPLGSDDALRWEAFARRLMLAFAILAVLLGGGTTALSAFRVRALLDRSLAQRGEAIAHATAHAAFVPLTLEDREALARVASFYEGQESLATLRIVDEHGTEWAAYDRVEAPTGKLLVVEAPIAVPGANPESAPVGRVVAGMDPGAIRATLAWQIATMLLFNGAFAAAILLGGMFVIRRLTTGMRELAQQAARAEELGRSNRELEEFAYIASHDLQAPLRRIAGFAQLLARRYKGKLGPEADEFVERITAGTTRMQDLIQDLLSYSRAGSKQLEVRRSDLNEVLTAVLADAEAPIREVGGRVVADKLPHLAVDPGQVSRLFANLVGNAIKFRGDAPPDIRITARRAGGEWIFTVADNGIGIEPQFAEDVFKMFRRLHPASSYAGTGIGLAVARKIVERHGGRIWVESETGKGAAFHFTLGPSEKEKGS